MLAVIEHTSHRITILGATAHPTASRVTQATGNLVVDLEDESRHVRFLIRDRAASSTSTTTPPEPHG
ncbi:hypothetical protein [Saccharothrix sp. Mg75]|uniref:hypothetical protein n=1 Tax=Saccharothrix sp. Mg75 TaxID=3445357 RepID=UPI003EE8E1BB